MSNSSQEDIRADEREPEQARAGATPLGQCIAEQVWPELGDVKGYEQYKREMENLAPWNEGIE